MLEKILDTIEDGIIIVNLEGFLIDLNEKFADMLGYRKDELIGKHLMDISPCDIPEFSAEHATPMISKLESEGYVKNHESSYTRKDGSVIFAEVNIDSLQDIDGNIVNYVAAVRDITKRKVLELRLRENEEFLRKIINTDPNLIFVKHRNGKYVEVSNGLAIIFGTTPEAVIGKTDLDFARSGRMSIGEAEKIRADDLSVINTGKQKFVPEESITLPDGTLKWYQTTKVPLTRNNAVDYVLGVAVDITDMKQVVDLLRIKELELEVKNQNLEELNVSLKVLLQQKEENRVELEEKVLSTTRTLVEPFLEKLANLCPDPMQQNILDIINTNLKEIVSGFSRSLHSGLVNLTATEIQVADLIKNGRGNKEIAELLTISSQTVAAHRKHIRKKLGINNTKTNLSTYLRTIK